MAETVTEYAVRLEHGEVMQRPNLALAQRSVAAITSRGCPAVLLSRTVVRSDWTEVEGEPVTCAHTGPDADTWFDRTLCAEPCGAMHSRCARCGAAVDGCSWETSL